MCAYTYKLKWSKLGVYYYGVRYSKNLRVGDIWISYFTSSVLVEEFVKTHGDPDIIKVKRVFGDSESALDWETKVLRRVNAAKNSKFINGTNNRAFSLSEKDKMTPQSKRKAKNRMRIKKTILNMRAFLLDNTYEPRRKDIRRIERYINIVQYLKPHSSRIQKRLNERLDNCLTIQKKPYPKNRKSSKRGPNKKISESKKGKKWYHDPKTKETKPFFEGTEPDGWVKGMIKNTPNNNTPESTKKISKSMIKARANESDIQRKQRLEKYYDTISKRKNKVHHTKDQEKSL